MILEMVSYKPEERITAIKVCENLIETRTFSINNVETNRLETLIS